MNTIKTEDIFYVSMFLKGYHSPYVDMEKMATPEVIRLVQNIISGHSYIILGFSWIFIDNLSHIELFDYDKKPIRWVEFDERWDLDLKDRIAKMSRESKIL